MRDSGTRFRIIVQRTILNGAQRPAVVDRQKERRPVAGPCARPATEFRDTTGTAQRAGTDMTTSISSSRGTPPVATGSGRAHVVVHEHATWLHSAVSEQEVTYGTPSEAAAAGR